MFTRVSSPLAEQVVPVDFNQSQSEVKLSNQNYFLLLFNYKIMINYDFFFRSGLRKGIGMQRKVNSTLRQVKHRNNR